MYYFVVGADGNRYGPADIDALVQWANEGRLVASTILIERGTDRQILAGSITAIAAALRRVAGDQPAVSVERDQRPLDDIQREAPPTLESPTVTRLPGPTDRPSPAGAAPQPPQVVPVLGYARGFGVGQRSRVVAGLLGIFLGGLGLHRFYLGYTGIGLLMLILSILSGATVLVCPPLPGAGCGLVWLWGFIEGVICLCGGMRDADGLELRT